MAAAVALVVSAAPAVGGEAGDAAVDEMVAVPSVVHVPRTVESYPFNAADHAREPVDLAGHGYVEEEFFLSGYANVYTKADGTLGVERSDVAYTNRILVRRPAQANPASGTVIVDIYNASNGYDINALRDPVTNQEILGGAQARTVLLVGQSQSGMYLNTYVNHFHQAVTEANGQHVFDGYLTAAANWVERPINDSEFQNPALVDDGNGLAFLEGPKEPVSVDVPWISVDTEGDALLFPKVALLPRELDSNARVWQVPGTAHTYSMSPVVPDNAELLKAGRPARTFPTVYTPYPGEPAMWAATQALVDADQRGTELPASRWFERDDQGDLVRDDAGNALGGVRYGLMESGVAQFLGAASPGDMNGVAHPIKLDEFQQQWTNRAQFLAKQRAFDNTLRQEGYLTNDGHALFAERAEIILDRIGVR